MRCVGLWFLVLLASHVSSFRNGVQPQRRSYVCSLSDTPLEPCTLKQASVLTKRIGVFVAGVFVFLHSFPTSPSLADSFPVVTYPQMLKQQKNGAGGSAELNSFSQSPGWELSRQKRTTAIKSMQEKGMLKVDTDDAGNQYLSLPWIPDRKVPYKSLSLPRRLLNEVSAGAFGEISKDILLHSVDTAKTRRQAKKKQKQQEEGEEGTKVLGVEEQEAVFVSPTSPLEKIKDLYAGFPVVLTSSIPQGGVFFLVKKSVIEALSTWSPSFAASFVGQAIPIGLGVSAYWLFRTPAEVLKTQVQTRQAPSVQAALADVKMKNPNGYAGLWKYYPVMLNLDIPFQIINFILFGALSDAVLQSGFEVSIWTRLFCGTTCGMISAGITCPIDVCKTRIISRDKAASEANFNKNNARGTDTATSEETSESEGDAISNNSNVLVELVSIAKSEGVATLFLGIRQRLIYTGLANGIRLAAYGTSRMDLMMRSLDDL